MPPPIESDITAEAVEAAMTECDQLELDPFLKKYKYGRPQDYWVLRAPGETKKYPAKAIVGVAHGFLPGGKPLEAKDYHGGYGEKEAVRTLRKLGFEVVSTKSASTAPPHKTFVSDVDATNSLSTQLTNTETSMFKPDPINLILYGPPGTGKTFRTAEEAVRLCIGNLPNDRSVIMDHYRRLVDAGRISFVTFHQSFSYEDFVEGLRPETDNSESMEDGNAVGFRLEAKNGVFRDVCALADQARKSRGNGSDIDLSDAEFFKMSLGRAGVDDHIFDAAIDGGYIVLGWGGDVDWSPDQYKDQANIFKKWNEIEPGTTGHSGNIAQIHSFRNALRNGDIVIVPRGNSHFRAVGVVTGEYEFNPTDVPEYNHRRSVKWLLVPDQPLPVEQIHDGKFTMRSCYQLRDTKMKKEALLGLLPSKSASKDSPPDQFVLIIDEINRANISKVFGELITLIEPDKRLGMPGELEVHLPYSRRKFGVPSNLHIVGTMNTADRSIALLDTALRRRFRFTELMPTPELLSIVDGVDLPTFLAALNNRIEYLFDRDHQIGHAFFMECQTRAAIDKAMRERVIPLLQEYFFEDWSRIAMVLGDVTEPGEGRFLNCEQIAVPKDFPGEPRLRWRLRNEFAQHAYLV